MLSMRRANAPADLAPTHVRKRGVQQHEVRSRRCGPGDAAVFEHVQSLGAARSPHVAKAPARTQTFDSPLRVISAPG